MMKSDVRAIPGLLDQLSTIAPSGHKVLSVYLDTSPERAGGLGYLVFFRDGCKALRAKLPASELGLFQAAAAQAERYLTSQFVPTHPGLALFASGHPSYFYTTPIPDRPDEIVSWGERPEVERLQEIVDEYERIAVALFDKDRARLYTIYLGEIEELETIVDQIPELERVDGRIAPERFGPERSRATYARHYEAHVLRHAKRVIAALLRLLRAHSFDRLFLAGPDEAVSLLRHQLPRPLRSRLTGSLRLEMFAREAAVLQAVLQAAEKTERDAEVAMVDELVEAVTSVHAALGLDDTLGALRDGRVSVLFVADTFSHDGRECNRCGALTGLPGPCPVCGEPMTPIADLGERAVERALQQGARVEIVSGDAAAKLSDLGGLGAWTRY